MNKYIVLVLVGILSGIVNAGLFLISPILSLVLAGVVYGAITGAYFIKFLSGNGNEKGVLLIFWILASLTSYGVCVKVSSLLQLPNAPESNLVTAFMFLFGGFCGSLILTTAFHFIFCKIKMYKYIVTVIVGSLLPPLFFLLFSSYDNLLFYITINIVWQGVITTMLGVNLLDKK